MRISPLDGLVAFVAGGGSGIGQAVARIIAANGGKVAVADLREQAAADVAASVAAEGGDAIPAIMDISDQTDIGAAVNTTMAKWKQLHIVVNCAALVAPHRLESWDVERWRKSFAVNVDGAIMLARTCLPHLRRSANASIVSTSSLAGKAVIRTAALTDRAKRHCFR
jgi:NAD(P)-dependent dehydrogenase (short-subunit alcohol dehydrogenase family)